MYTYALKDITVRDKPSIMGYALVKIEKGETINILDHEGKYYLTNEGWIEDTAKLSFTYGRICSAVSWLQYYPLPGSILITVVNNGDEVKVLHEYQGFYYVEYDKGRTKILGYVDCQDIKIKS